MRRLREALQARIPNLMTAAQVFCVLRRQWRSLGEAGRDGRSPAELVRESADGLLLEIAGREIADVRASPAPLVASQRREELLPFLDRVERLRPTRICEIGTAGGGTLFLLTRVATADAVLVYVDLELPWFAERARARLGREGQRVVGLTRDSHDPATRDGVVDALGGEPLDVLFIDGDHSYEGVRADFELYAPLVRSGGIVAIHDVNPDIEAPHAVSGEVPRFWTELKRTHRTEELIASSKADGYGIGLVYV
jgi:predicted O-methyltransferase YrrM